MSAWRMFPPALALSLALALPAPAPAAPPKPPAEAFRACAGRTAGADCQVMGRVSGVCRDFQGALACIPARPAGGGAGAGDGRPTGPPQKSDHFRQQPGQDAPSRTRPRPGPTYPDDATAARLKADAPTPTKGVPDTGQTLCFSDDAAIPCPKRGEPFFGQDAQYDAPGPAYRDNGDGTVSDLVTGLTWERAHHDRRLGFSEAKRACEALTLGGHDDWRLPGIKELYSLADFSGVTGVRPFIDQRYFDIREPDASILVGDPFAATHSTDMMGQTWSATPYAGDLWDKLQDAAFFFNFLDGRIKCAPTGGRNALFHRCVRGPEYGRNDFAANDGDTVTDRATGLMWQRGDGGRAMEWREALAYCATLRHGGHDDWRLPNVKELESIVDYSRQAPAIDTRFFAQSDPQAWFWSSTTFGDDLTQATYVCFGKCVSVQGVDVHGAGAQRSDPKAPRLKRAEAMGGQQDAVRARNHARCVRD